MHVAILDSILVTERLNVLRYGMQNISEEQWNTVWQRYSQEAVASAKAELRLGLARTRSPQLIEK